MISRQEQLAQTLSTQGGYCSALGSPLYASLLSRAASDVEAGGPAWEVLKDKAVTTTRTALRLMATMHRLALDGTLPSLAARFPSAGGDGDAAGAWDAFHAALSSRTAEIRRLMESTRVQTNEPGRSAALLGAFLEVSRRAALPLRLLEIGASAGLNLRWDHYRYDSSWGPEESPVRLDGFFERAPSFDVAASVVARGGCDPSPVDPSSPAGRLTLRSLVWADQTERLALLDAAIGVAEQIPVTIAAAPASMWLEHQLARLTPGVATVVFHSIVTQYMAPTERRRVTELISEAGSRASRDAPLARVWMEPDGDLAEIRLFFWPGGSERGEVLGHAGYHGRPVIWNS